MIKKTTNARAMHKHDDYHAHVNDMNNCTKLTEYNPSSSHLARPDIQQRSGTELGALPASTNTTSTNTTTQAYQQSARDWLWQSRRKQRTSNRKQSQHHNPLRKIGGAVTTERGKKVVRLIWLIQEQKA